MKLAQLQPHFIRYETKVEDCTFADGMRSVPVHYIVHCDLAEAQGISLLCPKCFQQNGGDVGTHWIEVTFTNRGASDDQGSHGKDGRPTRWNVSGDCFENLTLIPSIKLESGCDWHGFITGGEIR